MVPLCLLALCSMAKRGIPIDKDDTKSEVIIKIKVSGDKPETEAINVVYWEELFTETVSNIIPHKSLDINPNNNNEYFVRLSMKTPFAFVSIKKKGEGSAQSQRMFTVLENFIVKAGDTLSMQFLGFKSVVSTFANGDSKQVGWSYTDVNFKGKSRTKYALAYKLMYNWFDEKEKKKLEAKLLNVHGFEAATAVYFSHLAVVRDMKLAFLGGHLKAFDKSFSTLLKMHIIGDYLDQKYNRVAQQPISLITVLDEIEEYEQKEFADIVYGTNLNVGFSLFKAHYNTFKVLYSEGNRTSVNLYKHMVEDLHGRMRDRFLYTYIIGNIGAIDNVNVLIDDALKYFTNSAYREELMTVKNSILPGAMASNFSLPDREGKYLSLSGQRGKVILLDFWYTGCGACQHYFKTTLSALEKDFVKDDNVVFITVSIDKSKDLWLESINSGKYCDPGLINLFTEGKGNRHDVITMYKVNYFPKPVLINKNGKVISASSNELRNFESAKRLISNAVKQPS